MVKVLSQLLRGAYGTKFIAAMTHCHGGLLQLIFFYTWTAKVKLKCEMYKNKVLIFDIRNSVYLSNTENVLFCNSIMVINSQGTPMLRMIRTTIGSNSDTTKSNETPGHSYLILIGFNDIHLFHVLSNNPVTLASSL